MANRWGNSENSERLCEGGAPKSRQMVIAAMKFKDAYSLEESKEELKSLLMRVKEEGERAGLNLNIKKTEY